MQHIPLVALALALALSVGLGVGGCDGASSGDSGTPSASSSGDDGQGPATGGDSESGGDGPGTEGEATTGSPETADGTDAGTTTSDDGETTAMPADDEPVHVVVLGASTACGKNLDAPQYGGQAGGLASSWVNLYDGHLQSVRPGSVVTNLCQAGYDTYRAMPTGTVNPAGMPAVDPTKNITAALALDPDVVIVSFPAADEMSNIPEIVDNLETIASTAAAVDVPVWVATTQPVEDMPPATLAAKLQLRDDILSIYGDHALDFWSPLAGPGDAWDPAKMLTDGVHPNAVGHMALYDLVVAADIPAGALGR